MRPPLHGPVWRVAVPPLPPLQPPAGQRDRGGDAADLSRPLHTTCRVRSTTTRFKPYLQDDSTHYKSKSQNSVVRPCRSENAWKAWRRARPKQAKGTKRLPPPTLDLKESGTLYQVPDCGCVFLTASLDAALLAQMQLSPTPVEAQEGGGNRGGGAAPRVVQRGLSSRQTSNATALPAGQAAGCR